MVGLIVVTAHPSLDLVRLTALMSMSGGNPAIRVGLIDGPLVTDHPNLAKARIEYVQAKNGEPARTESAACVHGTFVAGILCASRDSAAPGICPHCTLLVRPLFNESPTGSGQVPTATPDELAQAIVDCVRAGARIINLSVAMTGSFSRGELELEEALQYAANREVAIVAAAGNEGRIGGSVITRHPWVIPVVAYNLAGYPMSETNLGHSLGRRGIGAPGENIRSLGVGGEPLTLSGTSAAAPFVSGTLALLCSEFPAASAAQLRRALTMPVGQWRTAIAPRLMDAWASFEFLFESRKQIRRRA